MVGIAYRVTHSLYIEKTIVADRRTHTHSPSTVTLAGHASRELISTRIHAHIQQLRGVRRNNKNQNVQGLVNTTEHHQTVGKQPSQQGPGPFTCLHIVPPAICLHAIHTCVCGPT